MRTPKGFLDWVAANPKDTGVDGEARPKSWAGKCVSLVRRAGGFPVSNTESTAALARAATVRNGHPMVITRYEDVPIGWFVYFDGPTAEGHVGMSVGGGSFVSATSFLPGALGAMPIKTYAEKRGVTYRGASPYFIDQKLEPDPAGETKAARKDHRMFVHGVGSPTVAYEGYTDANGAFRLRSCSQNQSAIVISSGLSTLINDQRLTDLGVEAGWAAGKPPVPRPKVEASGSSTSASSVRLAEGEPEKIAAAVIVEQKKPGN